jgi:hypothetical protein
VQVISYADSVMRLDSLKKYVTLRQALHAEKTKLETRLAAINRALGSSSAKAPAAEKPERKRPKFSAAARAAIAAAQRARWAKIKAAKKGK